MQVRRLTRAMELRGDEEAHVVIELSLRQWTCDGLVGIHAVTVLARMGSY
jgi:hypothetical protein